MQWTLHDKVWQMQSILKENCHTMSIILLFEVSTVPWWTFWLLRGHFHPPPQSFKLHYFLNIKQKNHFLNIIYWFNLRFKLLKYKLKRYRILFNIEKIKNKNGQQDGNNLMVAKGLSFQHIHFNLFQILPSTSTKHLLAINPLIFVGFNTIWEGYIFKT